MDDQIEFPHEVTNITRIRLDKLVLNGAVNAKIANIKSDNIEEIVLGIVNKQQIPAKL